MLLAELVDRYVLDHPYGISWGHEQQLRYSVSAWQKNIVSPLTTEDLCDEKLNTYLDRMRTTHSPDSIRTRRGNLLILWNYAYQENLAETAPKKVRRLRPIARMPIAWTLNEVQQLTRTAEEQVGTFFRSEMRKAPWWSSLIRTAYDTSLRLGDLLRLRSDQIASHINVCQHKTQRPVCVCLRPATVAAIDQTLADEPRILVWRLWGTRQTFYQHFKRLVSAAGIRRGTFKWLRRAAVTQIERVEPGAGTILAGHANRATTEQFYLDRSQIASAKLPPW